MQENKKYSKEEMYLAIELWQESGLSQQQFCIRERLSVKTFGYWLKKYREEQTGTYPVAGKKDAFIAVKVSEDVRLSDGGAGQIEISYPNGVHVSCPVTADKQLLKTLVNI